MATSGNFVTSNSGQSPPQMIFEWWRTGWGYGGGSAYHNISYHLKSYGGSTNAWSYLYNSSMSVDGTGYSWGTTQFWGGGRTVFGDYSKTLYTDGSGNRSFSASAQGGIYTNAINTSGSGSWSLDNIPMHATMTNASGNQNDEFANPWVDFSNPAGAAIDGWIELPGLTGTTSYASRSGMSSRYTWTLTTTELNLIRAAMTNVTSTTIRFVIHDTVGGSNSWSYIDRTITIVNGTPVFTTATYKDANSTTTTVTGNDQYIIQGQSTLELDIASGDKAVAQKLATMVKYNAFMGAINQDITYTTSAIAQSLGTVGLAANDNLRVRAIDSRGLYVDVTLPVNILPYAAPALTATATRTNNFETATTLHIAATISRLTIASTDKNTVNTSSGVQYRAKKTTDANYSGWNGGNWTNVASTTTAGAVAVTDFSQNFDRNYAWNIQVRVVDKLQTTTNEILLPQGIALFRIGLDGRVYNQEQPIRRFDIGDIYMTADSNMSSAAAVAARYGGTWVAAMVGKMPVGYDSSQTEFNTLEKTGGAKTHTLTIAEMPSHNHNGQPDVDTGGRFGIGGSNTTGKGVATNGTNNVYNGSVIIPSQGGGGAHNNLPPYITYYAWKRTA